MSIPTALEGRFVANPGFDSANTVFLLADDSNLDVELQVHAPGMPDADFKQLCRAIRDRLSAALVGLNDEAIIEVRQHVDESNRFRVSVNNPEWVGQTRTIDLVLTAAKTIVQASELTANRCVIALKRWECAVLVDWDEPFNARRQEYVLSLPAKGTGLAVEQVLLLVQRLEALCDNGVMVSLRRSGITNDSEGTHEITLWSPDGRLRPRVANEHVVRFLFALGTVLQLPGIHNIPVVQLTHPFIPFIDDGSEAPERYNEY